MVVVTTPMRTSGRQGPYYDLKSCYTLHFSTVYDIFLPTKMQVSGRTCLRNLNLAFRTAPGDIISAH